jgi:anti-sigma factor RsiW
MTDRPLSPRDLELLSAYLDNQLGDRDVKRLEARLADNAGLQTTLDELKRTRLMLRSLPKVRAPRNFTLSPKMVGEVRRPPRTFWQLSSSWGMVSAMSVMLLMIALMGDLMGAFTPAPLLAAGYSTEAMSLTAEMQAMAEVAPEVAMLEYTETPVPGEAVIETFAVPAADPLATQDGETVEPGAGVSRVMEDPATKEAMGANAENSEVAFAMEPPVPLYSPPWVRVVEAVLLVAAVGTIALALFWQRKA